MTEQVLRQFQVAGPVVDQTGGGMPKMISFYGFSATYGDVVILRVFSSSFLP